MFKQKLKNITNKTISYIVIFSMLLTIMPQIALGATNVDVYGNLKITLRLDVPEKACTVKTKKIKISLYSDKAKLVDIDLDREISKTFDIAGKTYTANIMAKDERGNKITNISDDIYFYDVEVLNLPQGEYFAKFTGEGYKDYTTPKAKIELYSQQIVVGTSNASFTIGDVNRDNLVNKLDLDLVAASLGKFNKEVDLNVDGIIDITDIAYVNRNINATGGAEIFDTTLIAYANTDIAKTEAALPANKFTVVGNIADIYTQNTAPVTITPVAGDIISIPTEFNTPVLMEKIEIQTPDTTGGVSGGTAEVIYTENGKEITETITFSSSNNTRARSAISARASDNVVEINLGKRVPVKKVTVNVTKVIGEDGQPSFAVVEEIRFLKDIVPENPRSDDGKVSEIKSTPGEKSVNLTWKAVNNATGYKVYYGEASSKLNKELIVDTNKAEVKGLENLVKYYFAVVSMSGEWESGISEIIAETPQPTSVPKPPDGLKVETDNQMLTISWQKALNAETHSVYIKKSTETDYKKVADRIKETQFVVTGLENKVEYSIYVTGINKIGESKPSLIALGMPGLPEIIEPNLPTVRRIPNSNIKSVTMADPNNVDMTFYPDGFNVDNVIDEDYSTHWTAFPKFWKNKTFTFEFNTPKTMDYMIYVPRLDGKYKESLSQYKIETWDVNDNYVNHAKTTDLNNAPHIPNSNTIPSLGYAVLPFTKTEDVVKISVEVRQWNGSPTIMSLSEVAFYEYYDMESRVKALYTDPSFTELNTGVTEAQIDALLAEINNEAALFLNKEIILSELKMAKALVNGDTSVLGLIKTDVIQRNPAIDNANHGKSSNAFQPLGIVGRYKNSITIYANIPAGETVTLIPTQYFAEVSAWQGKPIELVSGRNEITIPKIGSGNNDKGGSLYIQYTGNRAKDIKLHVIGGTEIPVLALDDFATITETQAKDKITAYINELIPYVKSLRGNLQHQILNSTEISMPHSLLSIPASQVFETISSYATLEESVDAIYNNVLAWEELMYVMNKTHGIDSEATAMQTRQNIRYMRMFGNAFMYAAGSHVGIGWNETKGIMQGKPTTMLAPGATANNLFGWGIAHEIGHNYDRLGKAEITNNIYSVIAQTYDGKDNILPSRLELSDKYKDAYEKVSKSAKGDSNDVFVQLVLYYQLHLAYDNGASDTTNTPLNFYNQVGKEYTKGTANTFTGDDRFAVVASKVAGKDLTEFFSRWGTQLSAGAIQAMKTMGPAETRALYYMNDETRRYRLAGGTGVTADIALAANANINIDNPKEVDISISHNGNDTDILGYEILRNGKSIAFTTDKIYSDVLGSANNLAFTYSVRAIDMLGKEAGTANAGEVKISYDKTIDPSQYTITRETDGTIIATFNEVTTVAGVKFTNNVPSTGKFEVKTTVYENALDTQYTVAKDGLFAKNDYIDNTKFINYFNKPGAKASDTRIWNYDVRTIKITGVPTDVNVEFISYPGDDITISENAIGKLASDYRYGPGADDVIAAGTVIVTGTYRGDPLYNTIMMQGKYSKTAGLDENQHIEERPINGYSLLFAEIPEDGEVSEISDGFYIFVPDIQKETDFDGEHAEGEECLVSALPISIKAELYRTVDPADPSNKRLTSNTTWITSPSEKTMPEISLIGG